MTQAATENPILQKHSLIIERPKKPPIAEWASANMRFDTSIDASPRYIIEKSPYAKPVFDWWLDPNVEEIFVLWPTQSGKSVLMVVLICYCVKNDPGPLIFVQNDEVPTKAFVKNRIKPTVNMTFPGMIRNSLRDTNWSDDQGAYIGRLHFWPAWSTSESRCRSWPRRYVIGDETSLWRLSRQVVLERTKQFPRNRKALWGTTPTFEFEQSWNVANNVFNLHRWMVACPHCGAIQSLEFKNLKFDHCKTGDTYNLDRVELETYYLCPHCLKQITERERNQMLQRGMAESLFPERSHKQMSLRITALDVPALPWGLTARKFLEAKENPDDLRAFINGWLVEPWREVREGLKSRAVMSRTMDLEAGVCPANTVVLGAGVDVQRGHVFCTVRAWMEDGRSMLVWAGHFDGRPPRVEGQPLTEEQQVSSTAVALQRLYDSVLSRAWTWEGHGPSANGPEQMLKIRFAAVDSGDGKTQSTVFDFAKKHYGLVFPVKGLDGEGETVWTIKPAETDALGKPLGLLKVYGLKTAHFRTAVVENYHRAITDNGAWLVCKGAPEEYGKHFESWQVTEVEFKDKRGMIKKRKTEWRQVHRDDHYLDCETYAHAFRERMPGLGNVIAGKASSKKYGVVGNAWGTGGV